MSEHERTLDATIRLGGEAVSDPCAEERTAIRKLAGGWREPVIVVEGLGAPNRLGTGYYYENKSGDRVYHPNAYRRAWGKPIYVSSTARVEVGRAWLYLWRQAGGVFNPKRAAMVAARMAADEAEQIENERRAA